MLNRAIQIATEAHKGQFDKGGHDYIGHPLRVMDCLETQTEKIVGVLHDVVEDTSVTLMDLYKHGFSDEVVTGVRCMTRTKIQTWNSYIGGVMGDKVATRVKICDLRDNLNLTRLKKLDDININSLHMYLRTYHKLIKHERENR